MSIADEIDRLAAQRAAGHLTEAEFEEAKARIFVQPSVSHGAHAALPPAEGAVSSINALRRSTSDRWIGGVCGGLAKTLAVESWIVRLVFVLCLMFAGIGLLPYLLLWIFVPPER